jgi:molybdenum-dependent DNA-binding transcriptional regulator ModE
MEMPEGLTEGGKRLFKELKKTMETAEKKTEKERKAKAADLTRGKILKALAAAGTITETAKLAGVSRKTIYSYMNTDAEFIAAYRDMKRGQVRDMADTMNQKAEKAAAFIAGILDDKEAPVSVKVNAAIKLLEFGVKFREMETAIDGAALGSMESIDVMQGTSPL